MVGSVTKSYSPWACSKIINSIWTPKESIELQKQLNLDGNLADIFVPSHA